MWPARFPTPESARPFLRDPMRLAERVYGGRLGNGPEGSGDGWRNRGRGVFQTTGAINYARAAREIGCPDDDGLGTWLTTREGGVQAAVIYWRQRGLSALADRGEEGLAELRAAVQGGHEALAELRALYARAEAAVVEG